MFGALQTRTHDDLCLVVLAKLRMKVCCVGKLSCLSKVEERRFTGNEVNLYSLDISDRLLSMGNIVPRSYIVSLIYGGRVERCY